MGSYFESDECDECVAPTDAPSSFNDKRRELLRAPLEARHGSSEEAPGRNAG
jgi:hypothetical protein